MHYMEKRNSEDVDKKYYIKIFDRYLDKCEQ